MIMMIMMIMMMMMMMMMMKTFTLVLQLFVHHEAHVYLVAEAPVPSIWSSRTCIIIIINYVRPPGPSMILLILPLVPWYHQVEVQEDWYISQIFLIFCCTNSRGCIKFREGEDKRWAAKRAIWSQIFQSALLHQPYTRFSLDHFQYLWCIFPKLVYFRCGNMKTFSLLGIQPMRQQNHYKLQWYLLLKIIMWSCLLN